MKQTIKRQTYSILEDGKEKNIFGKEDRVSGGGVEMRFRQDAPEDLTERMIFEQRLARREQFLQISVAEQSG